MPLKMRMGSSILSRGRDAEASGRAVGASGCAHAPAALAAPRPVASPADGSHPAQRSRNPVGTKAVTTLAFVAVTGSTWSPSSWRALHAAQQPEWPSAEVAEAVRGRLAAMPPLVFAGEARALRDALGNVVDGRAFLLQAGDCVESFHEFSAITIREKLKIMLQMAAVLTYGATLPVVKVGRIAGQFVKPRSSPTERVGDGEDVPSFRGHMVNGEAPTVEARRPDPERMLQGYHQSAATLNLVRAFTKGGFADLAQVHMWNQEFVASSPQGRRYEQLASEIERALRFMAAIGIDLQDEPHLHQVDYWTSHEGLLLEYEEALTRRDSLTGA